MPSRTRNISTLQWKTSRPPLLVFRPLADKCWRRRSRRSPGESVVFTRLIPFGNHLYFIDASTLFTGQ